MTATQLTSPAFAAYRKNYPRLKEIHEDAVRYDGDTDQMSAKDGLLEWSDGAPEAQGTRQPPDQESVNDENKYLWAITPQLTIYALEACEFGKTRAAGVIKHSNLTGGRSAHSSGELAMFSENVIAINGCSGRFRLDGPEELHSVAVAFARSGYSVWSTGFNSDTNRPNPFGVYELERVVA